MLEKRGGEFQFPAIGKQIFFSFENVKCIMLLFFFVIFLQFYMLFYVFSGRAPSKLTLELLQKEGIAHPQSIPKCSGHGVTVPGAAAWWVDTVEKFGSKMVL